MINQTFEQKLETAPEWQQRRFKQVIKRVHNLDLDESQKSHLLWISGQDRDTINACLSIIAKAQNKPYKAIQSDVPSWV